MNEYYVYQYIREDGTPYYIGKGKGRRAYARHRSVPVPTERHRILFVATALTEKEALELEQRLITEYGRKDLGTGILRNLSDGGESPSSGSSRSEEHRRRISEANRGKHVPVKARASLEGYIARYGPEEGPIRYAQDNTKKASMSLQAFIKRFGPLEGPIQYEAHRAEKSSRMTGECHPLYGKGHTEETKRKISNAKTGKKLERTAEHNAKIAAAMAGRKPLQDTCEHCGLTTSITNIKRWHNDKCKHR